MSKRVILITGTPCVGKTTIAKQLSNRLDAVYINLTDFAKTRHLTLRKDEQRDTTVVDEKGMLKSMRGEIERAENNTIIVDGHFAPAVVPENHVTRVFVLRRNPIELRRLMEKCGFKGKKLWENLAAEILDVCLVEALQSQGADKVCELDVTNRSVTEVLNEICAVLAEERKCYTGYVDWLGLLEGKGLIEEYLRI